MGCTFLKFKKLSSLFGLVHSLTSHRFVKVYKPSVELGSVDAGEFDLVTYMYTAGSAHSGSVDHYGVHGNDSGDIKLFGKLYGKFHDKGTDRDTFCVCLSLIDKRLKADTNITASSVRSVIGCDINILLQK